MIAIFVQNLSTATFYIIQCSLHVASLISKAFLLHSSMYVVAVISIDRYVRTKHYANFKRIWTTLALFQALICNHGFYIKKTAHW